MTRFVVALLALLMATLAMRPAHADGPIPPPSPQAAPVCPGGNAVIGYPVAGASLVCGTVLSGGSIAAGTNQLGVYTGTNSIGPLTPGGDVIFANPNFTVNSLRGGTITVPSATDTVALLGATQTLTGKTINCGNNTCNVRTSDLTGVLAGTNFPALTGDVLGTPGSLAVTIAGAAVTASKLAAGAAAANIGGLGGDLSGNLPNATVVGLRGRGVSVAAPSIGQALVWDGSLWGPGTVSGGGGTGLNQLTGDVTAGPGTGSQAAHVVAIGGQPISLSGGNSINLNATAPVNVTLPGSGTLMTNALPSGQIFVGSAGGVATAVTPSGDVTLAIDGTMSLPNLVPPSGCTNCNINYDAKGRIISATSGSGGGGANPGGAVGSLQFNNSGVFGGYTIGSPFSVSGGTFDLVNGGVTAVKLSAGAAASNIGALSGDLGGSLPGPKVIALQGFPIDPTPPTPNSQLTWNGSAYVPTASSGGITQLTGDVVAGPGSGSQTATIQPGAVTDTKLGSESAFTLKGNPTGNTAQPRDLSVAGGLSFQSGTLRIAPIITGQCITINTSDSLTISDTGQVISYVAGTPCGSTGNFLLADNGTDHLLADNGTDSLLADSSGAGVVPCAVNLAFTYSVSCNFISQQLLGVF